MAKAFLLGLCVVLVSFAISEGFKAKGAMEQILEANMNPGEINILLRTYFSFISKISFQISKFQRPNIFRPESWPCLSLDEVN